MTNATIADFEAIVVGAGPGGIAAMCALLDVGVKQVLWIDRDFNGGRLNTLYREISSNTKVGIYLAALRSSQICCHIIETTPQPNPVTELEQINEDDTCQLSLAGDMIQMIKAGILREYPDVRSVQGEVDEAILQGSSWTVRVAENSYATPRLLLCTGSYPSPSSLHKPYNADLTVLDLDKCMIRSRLPSAFPSGQQSTVAVIGNSHSGILVCRNLFEVAESGQRDVRVINFRRRPIKIAQYREDGIVWDNTGLKGATADWAKEHMLEEDMTDNDASHNRTKNGSNRCKTDIIRQVDLPPDEGATYRRYLPECTHIVYAIGYEASPLPLIIADGKNVTEQLEFDMHSSGFHFFQPFASHPAKEARRDAGEETDNSRGLGRGASTEQRRIPGLYGLGIAFPELVQDPEGHVEAAVGVAKFFKFAERVKEDWLALR